MGSAGFGAVLVRFAVGVAGVALVGCHSNGGSSPASGAGGLTAGGGASGVAGKGGAGGLTAAGGASGVAGKGGAGGLTAAGGASGVAGKGGAGGLTAGGGASGMAGKGGASATGGGGAPGGDGGGAIDGGLPASAACTPGVGTGLGADTEIDCTNDGTTFGVPNGAAVFGKTYVLPSPLVAGGNNALSFVLTGSGPFNFELWGTHSPSPCMGEELLWWGPFGAGTQCAQFKPSKAYTHVLFVYRQMYSSSYSFGTPSSMLCPGGTCPAGTTGTGKTSDTPITAPLGNYEMTRYDRVALGWDMTLGRTGRMTVSWLGDVKPAGQAQPLSAGVFRLPATDPYGDAWYCIGAGSTLTQTNDTGPLGSLKRVQVSLRGITRLGQCGATPGSGSLSAAMDYAPNSSAQFADISGTISSWTGTGLMSNQYCAGPFCNFRFRGPSQSHFLHLTATADNLGVSTTAPVPVTEATWLVQATTTEPFSMACSTQGTLSLNNNGPSTLQLAKVSGPLACPGTSIPNDSLDFTADAR